jgi:lysozyme
MRAKLLVAGLAAAGVLVAALGLERGWWRLNHPDPRRFPVWGIDVSHHQGTVDWAAVSAGPRIRFAYIKASEGRDFVDPLFARNWREARRAGLKVGAYHFFTFCSPGADQASHFLALVPRDADALPPAVDLELGGNCREVPEPAALVRELAAWLGAVERALGRRPVVYVTREAYRVYLGRSGLRHPIWIRDVVREPDLGPGAPWAFWQFHNRARVSGIDRPVDLDVFRADRASLDKL